MRSKYLIFDKKYSTKLLFASNSLQTQSSVHMASEKPYLCVKFHIEKYLSGQNLFELYITAGCAQHSKHSSFRMTIISTKIIISFKAAVLEVVGKNIKFNGVTFY